MKAIDEDTKKRLARVALYKMQSGVYSYCVNHDLEPYFEEILMQVILYFTEKVNELQEEEKRKEEEVEHAR